MIMSGNPKKIVALIMQKRAPSAERPVISSEVDEKDRVLLDAVDAFIDAVHDRDKESALSAFKEMIQACEYED